MLLLSLSLLGVMKGSAGIITNYIQAYGYAAIFGLMALEGSSLPVPSEVVMPLAGYFAAKGTISFAWALLAGLLGSIVGLAVDYYIAYFVGKDVVYKHLKAFHIKKESLDNFDNWFERNGVAAIFLTRLVPVIRTLVSFPAGFARMNAKKFFGYSILGSLIWDAVLMAFGFYALSANDATIVLASTGIFALALYLVYHITTKRMRKSKKAGDR